MSTANSLPSTRPGFFDADKRARLVANPAASVVLLIIATALYGFRFDIASLGVRVEHIALLVVGGFWAWQALRGRWRLTFAGQDLLLVLYLAIALVSSVLYAPIPKESLQYLGLMVLSVALYLLVRGLVSDAATFRTALLALVVVVALEALEGILTWLLYPLGINLRMQLYPLGVGSNFSFCTFSPQGTLVEANIYGSYVLSGALMTTFLFFTPALRARRRWLGIAILLMLVAIAVSLTRSVWVALAVGMILVLWFAETPRRRAVAAAVPMLALAALVALFASNFQQPCKLVERADKSVIVAPTATTAPVDTGTTTPPDDTGATTLPDDTGTTTSVPIIESVTATRILQGFTLLERLGTYGGVITEWLKNPWLGNGPNSFGQTHQTSSHTPAWISNAALMSLHDTGIVGTLILLAWMAWLAYGLVRAVIRAPPGFTRTGLIALGITAVGLALAYQLTTALWLGFTWVLLGLISAGTVILSREGKLARGAAKPAPPRRFDLTSAQQLKSVAVRLRANWLAVIVVAVGAATAFFRLGAKGLWGDEVWQIWWTDPTVFLTLRAPTDMPMQFVLVRLATTFSDSEFWVRLPSALLGAANVALLFFLGRRTFGTQIGVVAALLLATAPYHVWFAQDARPYSPLSFYSIVTLFFFLDLMRHPGRRVWLAFTVATALNILNHFMGLMTFGVEFVIGTVWTVLRWFTSARTCSERGSRRLKVLYPLVAIAISGLLPSLAILPLLIGSANFALVQGYPFGANTPRFQVTPTVVTNILAVFGAGYGLPLVLLFALFVIGVAVTLFRREWFVLIALAWLVVPFAVLAVIQPRYHFAPKFVLFMQPVYLLMIACGLVQVCAALGKFIRGIFPQLSAPKQTQVKGVVSSFVIAAAVLVMFMPTSSSYWIEKNNDWRAICTYLHRHVKPGDAVTGEFYTEGTINWCLGKSSEGVVLLPLRNYSTSDLTTSGWNVWYIKVLADSPNLAFLTRNYQEIPKSAWGKPGLLPSDYGRFPFSQGEQPATMYYYKAEDVPHDITFHQTRGTGSTPDYAQIGPGAPFVVRLSLPATSPRVLQISFFNPPGTELAAMANQILLPKIEATKNVGSWVTSTIPLPSNVPAMFMLELRNKSTQIAAVSGVKVEYPDANQ